MAFIQNLPGGISNPRLSPSRETRMAPRLLAVCCVCGLIRDELRPATDPVRWTTQRAYQKSYGVRTTECLLTHTYCPKCLAQAQNSERKYFRENGV